MASSRNLIDFDDQQSMTSSQIMTNRNGDVGNNLANVTMTLFF